MSAIRSRNLEQLIAAVVICLRVLALLPMFIITNRLYFLENMCVCFAWRMHVHQVFELMTKPEVNLLSFTNRGWATLTQHISDYVSSRAWLSSATALH